MKAGQRIRDYILEELIGIGGFGEVWLARHEYLDKQVAIKVLFSHLSIDLQFRERFSREAKAMARLDHPNILGVIDYFIIEGDPFLVMPYIEGGSLRDEIDQRGRLPLDEALRISHEVLDALDFAHQRAIIHRDIKPSNILLRDGHPIVTDFGIAKLVGEKKHDAVRHGHSRVYEPRANRGNQFCEPRRR